jgi:hypothetical protein
LCLTGDLNWSSSRTPFSNLNRWIDSAALHFPRPSSQSLAFVSFSFFACVYFVLSDLVCQVQKGNLVALGVENLVASLGLQLLSLFLVALSAVLVSSQSSSDL